MYRPFRFALFVLALAGICVGFALPQLSARPNRPAATVTAPFTVVLDAGHGGEDGGAVSADGLQEKTVNLAVTLAVRDLLEANGVRVVLTRDTDVLLYDRTVNFKGRKKRSIWRRGGRSPRKRPGAVFVSIHMNAFPQKQYRGLQVWYSPNDARSAPLASAIQEEVRARLQPENTRKTKQAGSNIYLLYHLNVPAVLIECGFLSNPDEAALLATDGYRQQLAQTVALGILSGLGKISDENAPRS